MWLPYFHGEHWVGCIQIARKGNCWVAADMKPDRSLVFEIQSVVASPGREEAAAQNLLKHVAQWLAQSDCSWWPELDIGRTARAMVAMMQDSN